MAMKMICIGIILLLGTTLFGFVAPSTANLQAVTWPAIDLQEVNSGFTRPLQLTHANDNSNRRFVVEQDGSIKIIQNGSVLPTAFLDISARLRSPSDGGGGEEGLLSVAFPPGFGVSRHHFYVYYTNNLGDNRVSRFQVSNANPNLALVDSEELILLLPHPDQGNHNGGQLFFGPDGHLYIGTGDGGGGFDPQNNAQNPSSLLGKLLRIDVEQDPPDFSHLPYKLYLPLVGMSGGSNVAYAIPQDNPFINTPGYRPEIWALGLRNPWRFSFDRLTGDLYAGDVGQGDWEEINFQPASSNGGSNYGWDFFEANNCLYNCGTIEHTAPVYDYPHTLGNCSVTGGYVYRGQAYPELQGIYFFADYCSGRMMAMQRDGQTWVTHDYGALETGINISAFGEDQSGELYVTALDVGKIYRIIQTNP